MGSLDDETGDGHFEQLFQELSATLKGTAQMEELSRKFSKLKTDQERVSYLLNEDCISDAFKLPSAQTGKSSSVSVQLRSQGNKLFQEKVYEKALGFYNDSVAHAPLFHVHVGADQTNKDLALALANRSATLFHLQQYEACLDDCDASLRVGYPENLQYKLYDRKGKCLLKIARSSEAQQCFQKALKSLGKCDLERKKKITWTNDLTKWIEMCKDEKFQEEEVNCRAEVNVVPCMPSGSHERFLSLSDACDVTYTAGKGRYIVAIRDIAPGETVLVEKPFASVLLPVKYASHCHHCYKRYLVAVPCHHCGSTRFCSENCRQVAWQSYHRTECACLELIHQSGMGKFGHLAVRTVTRCGIAFMEDFRKELASKSYGIQSEELAGCSVDGKYRASDYGTIYHLVTHDTNRSSHDLFKRACKAVYLLKCLQHSGFFSPQECNASETLQSSSKEMECFIGGCLLSHLQLLPCNAHEISEFELDRASVAMSVSSEIGAGIYSTLSLFNHSCDPAVTRNFYGDTCVVRAIKSIRKGEEVADNYGAVFAVQSQCERVQKLKPQYFFECQCEACVGNWPLYSDIPAENPTWKCDRCARPMADADSGTVRCDKCELSQNVLEMEASLRECHIQYDSAFSQLLKCDVSTSLPVFLECLSLLDKCVMRPWRHINNCQETIKQCFAIMGNCHVLE